MPRILLICGAALPLLLVACDKPQTAWQYPTPSPATRPAAVPSPEVLTLTTQADIAAAANAASDAAISDAVTEYLGPGAPRWRIVAARNVGDFVLLWIAFPEVADGGIDLVYSTPDHRVKWQFKGGVRG
jgi:hypothetical protein